MPMNQLMDRESGVLPKKTGRPQSRLAFQQLKSRSTGQIIQGLRERFGVNQVMLVRLSGYSHVLLSVGRRGLRLLNLRLLSLGS